MEMNLRMNKTALKLLKRIAEKYNLPKLEEVLKDNTDLLLKKDIYVCLDGIVKAVESSGDTLRLLREAKNVYGLPVFAVNLQNGTFLIKEEPDFEKAIDALKQYPFCFKLSPYHIINTYLAIVEAQVTGLDLKKLCGKGVKHIDGSIEQALKNNRAWDRDTLTGDHPLLIMPVGAAGCGKSTFYRELSNVVNISCDNIRWLLFKDFGPCFSSWESCLSWWVVNYLTDKYLKEGYNVFYNGVNTDLEYRSPVTMEDTNPLFAGMPYNIKLVYFESSVKLKEEELKELKSINLWSTPIDEINLSGFSDNVSKIIEMIRNCYQRTLTRTKEISKGKREQDPYNVLYAVPASVIKLFVEQSFDRPEGSNVTVIQRKELPDADQRAAFYRKYACEVMLDFFA